VYVLEYHTVAPWSLLMPEIFSFFKIYPSLYIVYAIQN